MKNRGPIDFLAALIVEFGGLALLLAAVPALSGSRAIDVAIPVQTESDCGKFRWLAAGKPTPWDRHDAGRRLRPDERAYVENRLVKQGEKLIQGLSEQMEWVLDDR